MIDQTTRTTDLLNRLVRTLYRSLPMYLAEAEPWVGRGSEELRSVLADAAIDYGSYVERLADMILELGGPLEMGIFPTQFTDLHDLSVDYLVRECIGRQQCDQEIVQHCVDNLPPGSAPRALAEAVLSNVRGHLERMLHRAG